MALILSIAVFTRFTPAYDVMHSLGTDMYIAPWTRILPYLIGVGSGYIMFSFNGVMPFGEVCNNIFSFFFKSIPFSFYGTFLLLFL